MLTIISQFLLVQAAELGTIEGPGPSAYQEPEGKGVEALLSNLIGFLTIVAGLTFLVYFILGAISWITAGGHTDKVEKSQSQMTNAAIGLIIVVAAYAIAGIVGGVVGLDILNPAQIIETLSP